MNAFTTAYRHRYTTGKFELVTFDAMHAQKWMSIKGINSSMSSIFPVVFHKKQSIEEKNIVLN